MTSSRLCHGIVAGLFLSMPAGVAAQSPQPLPEPLTLRYALSLADEASHPQVLRAQAEFESAAAQLRAAQALNDVDTGVDAAARWIEPQAVLAEQGRQDHRVRVTARKRLFDFGRARYLDEAARSDIAASQWALVDARARRRLDVMACYFDVLLADMEFAHDNEAMAVSFVTLDRVKERHGLGQQSEFEVLQAASAYEEVRRRRVESQARQRSSRARLALALDRPGELSSQLASPSLAWLQRELPPLADLQEAAFQDNPGLRALRARVEAAQRRVVAARADKRPVIDAEMGAGAYSRELGSNNLLSGGVTLRIPLFQGGRVAARIAEQQAETARLRADLAARIYEVRQAVLETWLELDNLKARRQEMRALMDYREVYLDRARTLYDQEARSDLGDAMVEYTNATLRKTRAEYQTLLAWATLDALIGEINGEDSGTINARVTGDPVSGAR